jgi:hypothetical protein
VIADTPVHTVFIVAGQVVGAAIPAHIRSACQRLAGLAHVTLLDVEFADSPAGSWSFAGATPCLICGSAARPCWMLWPGAVGPTSHITDSVCAFPQKPHSLWCASN